MKKVTYTVSSQEWFEELARLRRQLYEGILTDVVVDRKHFTISIIA